MDRFQELQVFVAVAEQQGFSAAARKLDISPPAVTRSVSALESRLGVQLFNRTTRFVRATEAGLRYLEDARRILELLEQADEAAAGINAEPRASQVRICGVGKKQTSVSEIGSRQVRARGIDES